MTIGYVRPSVMGIEEQQILAVSKLALGDPSVIPMWYGESDIVTDPAIRNIATASIEKGETFYTHKRGQPDFCAALSRYMSDLYDNDIGPERISVTQSGMAGIMLVFQLILEAGDNIVIVGPVWPNAQGAARIVGAEPRPATLKNDPATGWYLDLDDIRRQCDDRTRAIFFNSPNNPTGWVMPADQIEELLAFARERNIWLVADDVYQRMVYDGRVAPSVAAIAKPDDPVIIVNSFSKSWAMTGWRLGWITHPPELGDVFGNLIEHNYSCVPDFIQRAGQYAIENGEPAVAAMIDHCRRGRDICAQRLPSMPGVSGFQTPKASFYGFFRIEGTRGRTLDVCQALVREAKVGIAPGSAFGPGAEDWYRLCFAQDAARLSDAFDRLDSGLETLLPRFAGGLQKAAD